MLTGCENYKLSNKTFYTHQSDARALPLSPSDKVLVRHPTQTSKLMPAYQSKPATVVSRDGEEVTVRQETGSVVQ